MLKYLTGLATETSETATATVELLANTNGITRYFSNLSSPPVRLVKLYHKSLAHLIAVLLLRHVYSSCKNKCLK